MLFGRVGKRPFECHQNLGLVRSSRTGKDNDYGYKAIDRIVFCRRAGL